MVENIKKRFKIIKNILYSSCVQEAYVWKWSFLAFRSDSQTLVDTQKLVAPEFLYVSLTWAFHTHDKKYMCKHAFAGRNAQQCIKSHTAKTVIKFPFFLFKFCIFLHSDKKVFYVKIMMLNQILIKARPAWNKFQNLLTGIEFSCQSI